MEIVYSPEHHRQHGRAELTDGRLMPVFEHPGRIDAILEALARRGFPAPALPEDRGLAPMTAVHEPDYIAFLQRAWDEWTAVHGPDGDALPLSWRAPGMRTDREPERIDGRLGHWSFDAGTPITAGTWAAASGAAQAAAEIDADALRAQPHRRLHRALHRAAESHPPLQLLAHPLLHRPRHFPSDTRFHGGRHSPLDQLLDLPPPPAGDRFPFHLQLVTLEMGGDFGTAQGVDGLAHRRGGTGIPRGRFGR